jgi:hypothetical protein
MVLVDYGENQTDETNVEQPISELVESQNRFLQKRQLNKEHSTEKLQLEDSLSKQKRNPTTANQDKENNSLSPPKNRRMSSAGVSDTASQKHQLVETEPSVVPSDQNQVLFHQPASASAVDPILKLKLDLMQSTLE